MRGRTAALAAATTATALIAIVLGTTHCGSGLDEGLGGDVSLPSPIGLPTPFSFEGIPGPWWKLGATRAHFESDLRTCRDRSTEARQAAEAGAGHAAAYRTFLECMIDHAWNRGVPASPAPLLQQAS